MSRYQFGLIDLGLVLDAPSLRNARTAAEERMARAASTATGLVAREFERILEDHTRIAVNGNLWRAWASGKTLDRKSGKLRIQFGYIFMNGGARTVGALEAITESGVIKPRGEYLVIPLRAANGRGQWLGRRNQWEGNSPEIWQRNHPGEKLEPIKLRNGMILLVAVGRTTKKGIYRASKTDAQRRRAKQAAKVPIFLLVPGVSYRGRFSIETVMRPAPRRLVEVFDREAALISRD